MKKLFCVLSLVLGLLSMVFGAIYAVLVMIDLHEKLKAEKRVALEKIRDYIAGKLEVTDVQAQDVAVNAGKTE